MRIRTANRRRRRAHRREVYEEAFRYHMERCARLHASGRLDRVRDSGFVRRRCKRVRGFGTPDFETVGVILRTASAQIDDDLGNGGPMHHMFLNLKPVADNYQVMAR